MISNKLNLITAVMIGLSQAKRPESYRYGELASFERDIMLAHKNGPDFWVRVRPTEDEAWFEKEGKRRRRNGNKKRRDVVVHGTPAMSYKYGEKASEERMMSNEKHLRLAHGQPLSYRYGQKMNEKRRKNKRHTRRPHPPSNGKDQQAMSYRYGQHANKMCKACGKMHYNSKKIAGPRLRPFNGNDKIPSYRYGQEYMKKKRQAELRNIAKRMAVQDIMELRNMPVRPARGSNKSKNGGMNARAMNNEMDMIIKPLNKNEEKPKVKHTSEKNSKLYEDRNGKIRKAEQQMDIYDIQLKMGLKQRIVAIKAFNGRDAYMQGEFMILSRGNKPMDTLMFGPELPDNKAAAKKDMSAASVGNDFKDKWDSLKEKIDLNNERNRILISVLLGIFATLTLLLFFKVLFRAWAKLGRRNEAEENAALLKGELDSIHPISIVYKN